MGVKLMIGDLKKNLPELLITILSKDYPLRIKEIHTKLAGLFHIKISFQAVRKALNSLVDQGKLIIEKNEYQLNKEWIKENKKLSDQIVENYFVGEKKERSPKINEIGEQMRVFHFENSLQTDKFLGEVLLDIASRSGENILCIQALHYWYFLGHLGTESDFIHEMIKRNTKLYYLAFGGNTLLDQLSKKFYEHHGVHLKIVKKSLEKQTELAVIQNFIIRVQYPIEFIQKLENLFKQTKNIEDLNFLEFGKLIKSNYPITLTLFKDITMAKSIIETTLTYFT